MPPVHDSDTVFVDLRGGGLKGWKEANGPVEST